MTSPPERHPNLARRAVLGSALGGAAATALPGTSATALPRLSLWNAELTGTVTTRR